MKKEEVEKIIEKLRPSLQADGGDVELVGVDEQKGIVSLRLKGACALCPMSQFTLKAGIEAELKKKVKGVKEVVAL
jgi:Fe-S cluster biogenesis protein NfuA